MDPLVSIIFPVYNGEEFLEEAMQSLIDQTFRDFEIIALNDASTDNSLSILNSFQDNRLRIINSERNSGLTSVLNQGIALACGKFIARLDQDDVSAPQRLESQITFLNSNPDICLMGTHCDIINEAGEHMRYFKPPLNHDELVINTVKQDPFAHSSVIFKKQEIIELGGYPAEYVYAQDFALWLKVIRHHRSANIPEILTKIRNHSGQATQNMELQATKLKEAVQLFRIAAEHPSLSEEHKQQADTTIQQWKLKYQ